MERGEKCGLECISSDSRRDITILLAGKWVHREPLLVLRVFYFISFFIYGRPIAEIKRMILLKYSHESMNMVKRRCPLHRLVFYGSIVVQERNLHFLTTLAQLLETTLVDCTGAGFP